MAFELPPLPFAPTALEPHMSAETFEYHHGKHHKAYVDKTNSLIEGNELDGKPLREIVAAARGKNQPLFNNAGQAWNHGFYWHSLSPEKTEPSGPLAEAIAASFGSLDELNGLIERLRAG